MPKVVVSDASPLIGLAAIGKLWILRSFFSQITIAPGVFEEVTGLWRKSSELT